MKRLPILILVAFSAVCLTLMVLPMNDLPCQVTVSHKIARFVPKTKRGLAGEIRHIELSEDLIGVGRIVGSRVVCEVNVTGRS